MRLGTFPTPFQHVPDLGHPGLQDLWLKRDDLTGFAWGGNKVRTVEHVLADALDTGSDTIVVAGGPSSNFAALLSVAGATHGLSVRQVCHGWPRRSAALALSLQAGADVVFTGSEDKESMEACAVDLAQRLSSAGRQVYVVPRGGATPVGALGFASAAAELGAQLDDNGLDAVTVVLPVGSGGSIAGLLAGIAVHNLADRIGVVGVAVTRPPDEARVYERAAEASGLLGGPQPRARWRLEDGRVLSARVVAEHVLRGYGLVADPVYNAKALLWLGRHRTGLDGPLVYWSTGGLLAAADLLMEEDS